MALSIKTQFRHLLAPGRKSVVSDQALARLGQRVAASEEKHSGEICIYVESRLPNSYLQHAGPVGQVVRQRAIAQFGKLRVWDTENNNGVLIYLLLAERAIEIVADRGLSPRVSTEVWQGVTLRLADHLRAGRFEEGLAAAVDEVSALLTQHFPLAPGAHNPNELSDFPVAN